MAKKKSREDWKKEADNVKAILAAAKKKDHNFAMVICADGFSIQADPRLPCDNLWKKARQADGATPKGVRGVLSAQGSEVYLRVEEEPPGGIDAKFKQYLTKLGVMARPLFLMPGEEPPQPGAAEPSGDAANADAPDGETELSQAELSARLKEVAEGLRPRLSDMEEKPAQELKDALKAIAAMIQGGDLVGAQNGLNKLQLLTGAGFGEASAEDEADEGSEQDRKRDLTSAFAELKPDLQRSLKIANPEHKAELDALLKGFGDQMKAGELGPAEETLTAFRRRIDDFDRKRDEGVAARKARIAAIRKRIDAVKARLEEIIASQRVA